METEFEILIRSFIAGNIGITDNFLSDALAAHLTAHLLTLHSDNLLVPAGTGNADRLQHNKETRGDVIYWLDREHNNRYENEFLNQVEDFIRHLNTSCYAGITGYEFHYSLYRPGSFYRQHRDQFKDHSGRKYSMISYLNPDWQKEDGGELLIRQGKTSHSISPNSGKTVFFKSDELIHEVLPTQQPRLSVTGWLKS